LQSSFTYDDLNRLKNVSLSRGSTLASYSYTFDPTGNRQSAVELSGRAINWTYDGVYRLTNETISLDPRSINGSVGYGLDPVGNRLSQTSTIPGIAPGSYTYDSDDQMLSAETYDNNGNVTVSGARTFAYDFDNRLKSMNGGAVTVIYDGDGNRVAKTVSGVTTRYLVDDLNPTGHPQVVEELADGAVKRAYSYGRQRISQNLLVNSAWTPSFYGYDGGGTVRLLTDATGTVTDTYDYDAWGNAVNTTGSTPNSCLYRGEQYDSDLKLYYLRARYLNPLTGRFLTRDPAPGTVSVPQTLHKYLYVGGNPVRFIDPTGHDTEEASFQMALTSEALELGPEVTVTGSLEVSGGQAIAYVENLSGVMRSPFAFLPALTKLYTYDSMNRLLVRQPDPGLTDAPEIFTYTATGKRATMTDASGITTYVYDDHDRLSQKQTPQGTLTYTYDPAGNVASMKSSNTNGVYVEYTYDSLNRLQTVVDHGLVGQQTTTYSYDPASNLATVEYPNGLQSTFTPDTLNRLTSLNNGKLVYDYTLDAVGNRSTVVEHLPNQSGRTVNWSYDHIYRLTDEVISLDPHSKNGNVHYDLDPVGNRTQESGTLSGLLPGSFTYDFNDRLNTETYDNNGNTLTSGGKTFVYDFANRLKSMSNGAVTVVYDGDDNRAAKTAGGVSTRYLVDDLNPTRYSQVVEELVDGAVQRTYTYGSQRISENQLINSARTPTFYGYDGTAAVRFLTDATGTVTDTYDYDAFGNPVNSTGATPNLYLYRGEQYDPDLGLYYLRARYFNPVTGRFLSKDPLAGVLTDPATLHKYLYAAADPVNRLDPSGKAEAVEAGLQVTQMLITSAAIVATVYTLECFAVHQFTTQAGWLLNTNLGWVNPCKGEPRKCICAPCIPPVGTLGYRVDPPHPGGHFDKPTQTRLWGDHWHLYKVGQTPPNECRCQWDPLGISGPYPPPPAGAIPMNGTPGGGGCR
jgi:RHS repeat-associated protein